MFANTAARLHLEMPRSNRIRNKTKKTDKPIGKLYASLQSKCDFLVNAFVCFHSIITKRQSLWTTSTGTHSRTSFSSKMITGTSSRNSVSTDLAVKLETPTRKWIEESSTKDTKDNKEHGNDQRADEDSANFTNKDTPETAYPFAWTYIDKLFWYFETNDGEVYSRSHTTSHWYTGEADTWNSVSGETAADLEQKYRHYYYLECRRTKNIEFRKIHKDLYDSDNEEVQNELESRRHTIGFKTQTRRPKTTSSLDFNTKRSSSVGSELDFKHLPSTSQSMPNQHMQNKNSGTSQSSAVTPESNDDILNELTKISFENPESTILGVHNDGVYSDTKKTTRDVNLTEQSSFLNEDQVGKNTKSKEEMKESDLDNHTKEDKSRLVEEEETVNHVFKNRDGVSQVRMDVIDELSYIRDVKTTECKLHTPLSVPTQDNQRKSTPITSPVEDTKPSMTSISDLSQNAETEEYNKNVHLDEENDRNNVINRNTYSSDKQSSENVQSTGNGHQKQLDSSEPRVESEIVSSSTNENTTGINNVSRDDTSDDLDETDLGQTTAGILTTAKMDISTSDSSSETNSSEQFSEEEQSEEESDTPSTLLNTAENGTRHTKDSSSEVSESSSNCSTPDASRKTYVYDFQEAKSTDLGDEMPGESSKVIKVSLQDCEEI